MQTLREKLAAKAANAQPGSCKLLEGAMLDCGGGGKIPWIKWSMSFPVAPEESASGSLPPPSA